MDLARLTIDPVLTKADSLLWNAYIERHHYLGHQLMPGAQLRYFVRAAGHIVAALGFGASAWKVKPRDQVIGWTSEQRQRNLHLVVNNARFLILPWIRYKNLASRILALVSRRLPDDWHARYAYRPVLLETFVEKPRFTGTCYKAANWQNLGDTQGRGKLDVLHRNAQPIKSIWIYPLARLPAAALQRVTFCAPTTWSGKPQADAAAPPILPRRSRKIIWMSITGHTVGASSPRTSSQ